MLSLVLEKQDSPHLESLLCLFWRTIVKRLDIRKILEKNNSKYKKLSSNLNNFEQD